MTNIVRITTNKIQYAGWRQARNTKKAKWIKIEEEPTFSARWAVPNTRKQVKEQNNNTNTYGPATNLMYGFSPRLLGLGFRAHC